MEITHNIASTVAKSNVCSIVLNNQRGIGDHSIIIVIYLKHEFSCLQLLDEAWTGVAHGMDDRCRYVHFN